MSLRIKCSNCEAPLHVPDDLRGKRVRCSRCKELITVPAKTSDSGLRQGPPSSRPGKDDMVPPKPPRRTREDDDWEDEEDEPPRRRSKERRANGQKSALPWIIGGGGGLLAVGVIVLVIVLVSGKSTSENKPVAQGPGPANPQNAPQAQMPQVNQPPVQPLPKQAEVPQGPLPDKIAPDTTRKVKAATAYLKVTLPAGNQVEGSGFFAAEPGLVFTNAHVLGMLNPGSAMPGKVDVVVNSGEPNEFTLAGQVLGVDRDNDLGVLRVTADAGSLPSPLPVDSSQGLTEVQKVYIFGFPLGATLGKAITVAESSISSLRKGKDGALKEIQVNGGMHPGNSGGPVVDTRGVVVGVAVSGFLGTQINFAVPGEKVQGLLRGRLDSIDFGEPFLETAQVKLPVQLRCLDPLGRIRDLKLEVWTGNPGPARPLSLQKPAALPGDAPRQSVPLPYRNGQALANVPLPAANGSQALWIQPVLTDATGVTHWAGARALTLADLAPLEHKPALLQQRFDTQPDRTVKLHGDFKVRVTRGGADQFSLGTIVTMEALEMAKSEPGGGDLYLSVGSGCEFIADLNGRTERVSPPAERLLEQRTFTFKVNPDGHLRSRSVPTTGSISNPDFDDLVSQLSNSYEMTCLSVPNRQVQPKETWQATLPVILSSGKTTKRWVYIGRRKRLVTTRSAAEIADMHLTCTYEGNRMIQGQNQAVITVRGFLKARTPGRGVGGGKVTGKIHFGIDKGFLTLARLQVQSSGTVQSDEGKDLAVSRTLAVDLSRVPGNTKGIVARARPPVNPLPPWPGPVPRPGQNLAGTTFTGTENLAGFGKLTFKFLANGRAIMIDARSTVFGTYTLQGNQVVISLPGSAVYSGTLIGLTITGTGRDDKRSWSFRVTRQGGNIVVNPLPGPLPLGTLKELIRQPGPLTWLPLPQGKKALPLIPLIDLPRDVVHGRWSVFDHDKSKFLCCPEGNFVPRVQIPYQPPAEYDFSVAFAQPQLRNGISLVMPNPRGGSFFWFLGADAGRRYGFGTRPELSKVTQGLIQPRTAYTTTVQVRRDGVKAYLNGKLLLERKSDFSDLTSDNWRKLKDETVLAVACDDPTVFYHVQVVEISGSGKKLATAANPLPGPAPVAMKLFSKGPCHYLANLQEFEVRSGPWPFRKGDNGNGQPIVVEGRPSPHGLGMHPPSAPGYAAAKFRLNKQAAIFKARVAINDSSKWCFSPAIFKVFGDGKELWQSKMISHDHDHYQDCQIAIKGVDILELRVGSVNQNIGVHAVWFEPRVLQKIDSPDSEAKR